MRKNDNVAHYGGFIEPHEGQVFFDGKLINKIPPYKRQVNTVFQKYALFPHLNVFENIAFGLRLKKTPEKEIKQRVLAMLELVNLKGYGAKKVDFLSGGQQQRVAIARALINHRGCCFSTSRSVRSTYNYEKKCRSS